ncbi:MAG: signal peptidase I [Candidatus Berkelbacteria bacterium Licking1014_85]|uniref:Signal peptidase I n=1 Tax=Candidatus Berkelbacteria bacterium Licking1014_85 TaxID=2017148 RepID=A0A554LJT2_9BACT|nr:MAG: signal peptidase I [Candidatus Berkelbacteria bacterium Licking1014_85]
MLRPFSLSPLQNSLVYIYSLGRWIIWVVALLLITHIFIATIFIVDGPSMEPSLYTNNVMIVNKLAYLTSNPKRGDIVVLKFPGDPDKRKFVKRVIALPGETVEIRDQKVYINDQLLIESYLDSNIYNGKDQIIALKNNEYFTCGDNRPNSNDSRFFGAVPKNYLIGRTGFIAFPVSAFGFKPEMEYNI